MGGRGGGDGQQHVPQRVERVVEDLRDEVGRPALDRVRLEGRGRGGGGAIVLAFLRSARDQQAGVRGLSQHDLELGPLLLELLARAVEGAARAVAGDPVRESLALGLKVGDDLGAGGLHVELPVGLVLELVAEEPAVLLAELLRLAHLLRVQSNGSGAGSGSGLAG